MVLALAAASCSGENSTAAEGDASQQVRITLDELFDPERDVELSEFDGVVVGPLIAEGVSWCEAIDAAPLEWADAQLVPVQALVDVWGLAGPVPLEIQDDVGAMREFAQSRLDWWLGKAGGANQRPRIDLELAERFERIADSAAANCELTVFDVGGFDLDGDEFERARRCRASLEILEEGIDLYESLRGTVPTHTQQIEWAGWVEYLRTQDDDLFWLRPSFHRLDSDGGIVAIDGCDQP